MSSNPESEIGLTLPECRSTEPNFGALEASIRRGWRGPVVSVWGERADLESLPSLLCEPGRRAFARDERSGQTLWADVVVVDEVEPLDDIGRDVLRAEVVADDVIAVTISEARRPVIAAELAVRIASLQPDRLGGDHVHIEWFEPIDDPAVTEAWCPYISWVLGVPPEVATLAHLRPIASGRPSTPAAVVDAERALGVDLPSDVRAVYTALGGVDGEVLPAGADAGDGGWLILHPVEELPRRTAASARSDSRFVVVGTDGGAEAYVLDYRHDPPRWAVVPFIDMDATHALDAGASLAEFVHAVACRSFWAEP